MTKKKINNTDVILEIAKVAKNQNAHGFIQRVIVPALYQQRGALDPQNRFHTPHSASHYAAKNDPPVWEGNGINPATAKLIHKKLNDIVEANELSSINSYIKVMYPLLLKENSISTK